MAISSDRAGPVVASGLQRLAGLMLETLLPAQCSICAARVMDVHGLCPSCWGKLEVICEPCCAVSGVPLAYDTGPDTVSPAALSHPPDWDSARAAVVFDDASRGLVHALKYRDRQDAALVMARMMRHAGRTMLAHCDLIVPVPLYRWRLWARRFNQSALLARTIAEDGPVPYRSDILLRRRPTRAQVGLDHAARRRNVKGAFGLDGEKAGEVAGRRVVLVDDVITTGATACAAARALKAAGAARVDVLAFALVLNPSRAHI